ncbi:hypothetical protein HYH03_003634 [Edaphochlamys debaryana]|uniref:Uncharacterized protein n=1 Tax=Edaphochlamys debaryana TaxID=47281 RepID=A0A835Y8S9_9CHLO|nr:hypothetical protein HYH03_003634 [Edaphochlamys debaryana]|eukprot:KAG2498375.1 hypothetical protein HYH03_003634 [Edaphochlamys debaryana]
MCTPVARNGAKSHHHQPWVNIPRRNGLGPRPFPLYPDGTFVSDKPDECGDPHQDSSSFFIKSIETPVQATYASGSEISITITVRAQHGGYFMLKSCFDSFPATVSGTSYTRWWIQSSQYTYTIRWRLPNVEASGSSGRRYVMQLTYRTANSCVDQCSAAECGDGYAAQYSRVIGLGPLPVCGTNGAAPRTEIFKDCRCVCTYGIVRHRTPSPAMIKAYVSAA